jgi:uncharacterized membrane protein
MADTTKQARRRGSDAAKKVDDARSEAEEQSEGVAERTDPGSNGSPTITGEIKDTVREAAIEILRPAVRKATTAAAKYAVTQGPSLITNKVGPKVADAGGAGALAKGLASKGGGVAGAVGGVASALGGKLGKKEGESPSGTGRGRRLPVQEYIDVGVDLETAYDQFTQFEDWPEFMHRVERIEQRDDSTLMWHENIWGVRRSWEAEITEQTPCERLVWRSKGGPQTIGIVTFHRLSDRLTRIAITMDFQPKGLFEKTASGTRISRRALKSDLMRFKAFIELRDEATGAWRGRIEEGEVTDEGEDVEARGDEEPEEEYGEADEPTAAEDEDYEEELEEEEPEEEEPEASEEEEPEASEEEEEEEEEEEPEDEKKPAPRRRSRTTRARRPKAAAGRRSR